MNELESIFSDDKGRKPNIRDLNNMKYIDLVIKESLRMYPPAPYFGREIEEDIHYSKQFCKQIYNKLLIYSISRRSSVS